FRDGGVAPGLHGRRDLRLHEAPERVERDALLLAWIEVHRIPPRRPAFTNREQAVKHAKAVRLCRTTDLLPLALGSVVDRSRPPAQPRGSRPAPAELQGETPLSTHPATKHAGLGAMARDTERSI